MVWGGGGEENESFLVRIRVTSGKVLECIEGNVLTVLSISLPSTRSFWEPSVPRQEGIPVQRGL